MTHEFAESAETCRRIATMALHGLQRLERRKFVCGEARAPTMSVRRARTQSSATAALVGTERQVFRSNVAEEACGRAVLFVLREESPWLVDVQWLRLEKTTQGV